VIKFVSRNNHMSILQFDVDWNVLYENDMLIESFDLL